MNIQINRLSKDELALIKVGDTVERMLGFRIPCPMTVTSVNSTTITLNAMYTFDRETGIEVDDDISVVVSYIRRVYTEEQIILLKAGVKPIDIQYP